MAQVAVICKKDDLWVESPNYSDLKGSLFGSGWEENVEHALCLMKGNFDWQREKLTEQQYNQLKKADIPIEDVEVTGSFLWRKYNYGAAMSLNNNFSNKLFVPFAKMASFPPSEFNWLEPWWHHLSYACQCHVKRSPIKRYSGQYFCYLSVPGPFNFQPEKVTLGSNVKEYVGFYAIDERSKGFACDSNRDC
ncbi:hypothetical protein AB6G04_00150 [Proteus mirabilis]|uniref:hypothetical protein n=1 Tax=Proteus mirabilis TaxID=584 RepID=UPI0034DD5380